MNIWSNIRGYFNASWGMLSRDDGWLKPVFLLSLALFVPIVGPFFALGYCLEWARLTAWGVDVAPKQKGIGYGECIKSGFRGVVILLAYSIAISMAMGIIRMFIGWIPFLSTPLSWLGTAVSIAATILGYVAALRATIYQRFGAGFQMDRIWDMLSEDPKGLVSLMIIQALWMAATTLIASLAFSLFIVPVFPELALATQTLVQSIQGGIAPSRATVVELTQAIMGAIGPALAGISLFSLISMTMLRMIVVNAVGLWVRQFDVPRWSTSEAPLPQRGPVNTWY